MPLSTPARLPRFYSGVSALARARSFGRRQGKRRGRKEEGIEETRRESRKRRGDRGHEAGIAEKKRKKKKKHKTQNTKQNKKKKEPRTAHGRASPRQFGAATETRRRGATAAAGSSSHVRAPACLPGLPPRSEPNVTHKASGISPPPAPSLPGAPQCNRAGRRNGSGAEDWGQAGQAGQAEPAKRAEIWPTGTGLRWGLRLWLGLPPLKRNRRGRAMLDGSADSAKRRGRTS